MSLTDRTIDAQAGAFARLATIVRTLSDDDLGKPSGASEWTVAQVLSHLGSGTEIGLDTLRYAQKGEARPGELNHPVWDRWNALNPREQADGFLEHGQALVDAVADLSPGERTSLKVPLGFLPEPAGLDLFLGMRLNEDALHGWDVDIAYDDGAEIPQETAEVLLDQHRGPLAFMLGFSARPAVLEREATLAVTTPQATFGLALADKASLTDAPADPDGELRLPLPAFLRLIAGRNPNLPPDALTGSVTSDELRQVFPGY